MIDELKAVVPIWKKEFFADGSQVRCRLLGSAFRLKGRGLALRCWQQASKGYILITLNGRGGGCCLQWKENAESRARLLKEAQEAAA